MADALHMPEMTVAEFADHMTEEDFHLRFGNPVLAHGKNGHDLVCMTREYYEHLTARLAEIEEDENIKYWIYEFAATEQKKLELEQAAARFNMTPDEFIESALEGGLRTAETDPTEWENRKRKIAGVENADIHLVRYYESKR